MRARSALLLALAAAACQRAAAIVGSTAIPLGVGDTGNLGPPVRANLRPWHPGQARPSARARAAGALLRRGAAWGTSLQTRLPRAGRAGSRRSPPAAAMR
jgi:hypothetical protein